MFCISIYLRVCVCGARLFPHVFACTSLWILPVPKVNGVDFSMSQCHSSMKLWNTRHEMAKVEIASFGPAGVWHSHPSASTVVVSLVQVEDGALVEVFDGRIHEGDPKGCKY